MNIWASWQSSISYQQVCKIDLAEEWKDLKIGKFGEEKCVVLVSCTVELQYCGVAVCCLMVYF